MKIISFQKLLFFLICTVLLHFESFAQKEGNNWYFGDKAGITFNTDTASVLLNGQANGNYGNATISDKNGNLLFYFAGGFTHNLMPNRQIFDRNHQPMPNGSGLFGFDLPSYIIPWPGTQKYFLITYLPGPNRYCYSVIDMALNNGFGDVTAAKNVPIMALNNMAQHNSAPVVIKHRNNRDYWLILPTFTNNGTTFNAFGITPSGLNLTPVISATPQSNLSGGFRASPDGRTMAGNSLFGFDLFNFDPAAGLVTHRHSIGLGRTIHVYWYEFSPDGTKLYCKYAKPGQPNYMRNFISQFDLTAPNPTDIFLSATTVPYIDSTAISTTSITDMKLGPDGKIYINGPAQSDKYISIIHRPNLPGKAAFFELEGLNLDPNNTGIHTRGKTFPTTDAGVIYRPNISMQQGCSGDSAYFSLANSANVDSVKWD
ncbi:MAG TPA: hypothetical protein VK927_09940, partial [Adhaeribacter sp.]|nr:hypothetical protein [Adhaeribacter sp.]